MEYIIKFDMKMSPAALQQLVAVLDNGPHGLVRPLVDNIIAQVNEQNKAADEAAKAAADAAPTDVEVKEPTPLP